MTEEIPEEKSGNSLPPEAGWYDRHYSRRVEELATWNRFLIEELLVEMRPGTRLLELGCGQGQVLLELVRSGRIREEDVSGVDQSDVAINHVRGFLPRATLLTADIQNFDLPTGSVEVCVMMETIELLTCPEGVMRALHRITAPEGVLYLSFPNYIHLPWLLLRILAEKLNKPNWINLQPIDRIYTVFGICRLARNAGFVLEKGIGTTYCLPLPPNLLRRFEPPWLTRCLNSSKLWWLSFHPILKFRKNSAPDGKSTA